MSPSSKVTARKPAVLLLLLVIIACSSDDNPAAPDNGTPPPEDITVVSMANQSDWQFTPGGQGSNVPYDYYDHGVFSSRPVITPMNDGTGRCTSATRYCVALSADRMDFSQYSAAHVTFRYRLRTYVPGPGDDGGAELYVGVRSNVPGTPNLTIFQDSSNHPSTIFEETIDLSLENALGFKDGSVEVTVTTTAPTGASTSICDADMFVEVYDFRVIAKK